MLSPQISKVGSPEQLSHLAWLGYFEFFANCKSHLRTPTLSHLLLSFERCVSHLSK